MDENDNNDQTDAQVSHTQITRKLDLLATAPELKRVTEEPEASVDTSAIKIYPFVKTHLSWKQRVLGWFRKS